MPIQLNRTEATWGLRYMLFQLAFLPSLVLTALQWIVPQVTAVALDVTCWSINFCVVCGIFHSFLWTSLKYSFKNVLKVLLTALAGFGIYWVLNMALNYVLARLFPQFFNVNDAHVAVAVGQSYPLMFLGAVVLVPMTEELFYRGVTFGLLYNRNRWLAYGVSVILFGAIHVAGYIGHYEPLHLPICFLQYLPAGLVLAGAFEYSGSIFAPTLIHMAVNAIAISSMR